MTQTQFFIGMPRLEDLLDAPLAGRIIYLNAISESLPTSHPSIRWNKQSLVAARVDTENGLCYYWQMPVGSCDDWGHGEHREKMIAIGERARIAKDLLAEMICNQEFSVVDGSVAVPKDYKLLDGTTGMIEYDKESDRFLPAGYKEPNPEALPA